MGTAPDALGAAAQAAHHDAAAAEQRVQAALEEAQATLEEAREAHAKEREELIAQLATFTVKDEPGGGAGEAQAAHHDAAAAEQLAKATLEEAREAPLAVPVIHYETRLASSPPCRPVLAKGL